MCWYLVLVFMSKSGGSAGLTTSSDFFDVLI